MHASPPCDGAGAFIGRRKTALKPRRRWQRPLDRLTAFSIPLRYARNVLVVKRFKHKLVTRDDKSPSFLAPQEVCVRERDRWTTLDLHPARCSHCPLKFTFAASLFFPVSFIGHLQVNLGVCELAIAWQKCHRGKLLFSGFHIKDAWTTCKHWKIWILSRMENDRFVLSLQQLFLFKLIFKEYPI